MGFIRHSYATNAVQGRANVGQDWWDIRRGGGKIEKSYASGNISSLNLFGGGSDIYRGRIVNSYSTGNVTALGKVVDSQGASIVTPSQYIKVGSLIEDNSVDRLIPVTNSYVKTQFSRTTNTFGNTVAEKRLKSLTAIKTGWRPLIWIFKKGEYPKLKSLSKS